MTTVVGLVLADEDGYLIGWSECVCDVEETEDELVVRVDVEATPPRRPYASRQGSEFRRIADLLDERDRERRRPSPQAHKQGADIAISPFTPTRPS